MDQVGIPKKLIGVTKMCLKSTQYHVRVDKIMTKACEVKTGPKQGDALLSMLFNLALEFFFFQYKGFNNYGLQKKTCRSSDFALN